MRKLFQYGWRSSKALFNRKKTTESITVAKLQAITLKTYTNLAILNVVGRNLALEHKGNISNLLPYNGIDM